MIIKEQTINVGGVEYQLRISERKGESEIRMEDPDGEVYVATKLRDRVVISRKDHGAVHKVIWNEAVDEDLTFKFPLYWVAKLHNDYFAPGPFAWGPEQLRLYEYLANQEDHSISGEAIFGLIAAHAGKEMVSDRFLPNSLRDRFGFRDNSLLITIPGLGMPGKPPRTLTEWLKVFSEAPHYVFKEPR